MFPNKIRDSQRRSRVFCGSSDLHLQATWETRSGGSLRFYSSAEADRGWLAHHRLGMVKALDKWARCSKVPSTTTTATPASTDPHDTAARLTGCAGQVDRWTRRMPRFLCLWKSRTISNPQVNPQTEVARSEALLNFPQQDLATNAPIHIYE